MYDEDTGAKFKELGVENNQGAVFRLCCSVLQCVVVCCSVLQCVAVYGIVLQCVAMSLAY